MQRISFSLIFLIFLGCAKEELVNPYDDPNLGPPDNTDTINYFSDSLNFASLYHNVFSPYCANSGCHDGAFEPDFRTIESSYNTLVFQPVIKNDINTTYQYRVAPNNPDMSVLYIRLTEKIDPSSEIMPIDATYNPEHPWHNDKEVYIENIKDWINDGAKDMFGQEAVFPNKIPEKQGVVAYQEGQTTNSLSRLGVRGAIQIPSGLNSIDIWFSILDDNLTANQFSYTKVKFSDNLFDFADQSAYNLEVFTNPHIAPGFYITDMVDYYLKITYDISNLAVGDEIFFKVYVDDNTNGIVEIPNNGSSLELIKYFAFEVI